MKKNFRISARRIFLTYPRFNSTKDSIKEQLFSKLAKYQPFDYCISQELHQDSSSHFHIYLANQRKFNIPNAQEIFKLSDVDNILKSGDYKPVKNNASAVLRYLVKYDKTPLTNMAFIQETGMIMSIEEKIVHIYESEGYVAALKFARYHIPKKDLLRRFMTIKKQLKALHKNDIEEAQLNFLNLDHQDFENSPAGQKIEDWYNNYPHKTLYLSGKSGIGKTEALKSFLADKIGPDKLAFVRHLEGLKRYNMDEIKAIIADDLPLSKIYRNKGEALIHLLDRYNHSEIDIRFQIVRIKSQTILAITSNTPIKKVLKDANIKEEHIQAVLRRLYSIHTDKPFAFIVVEGPPETASN